MNEPFSHEEIAAKNDAGIRLTDEEEMFYLTKMLNHTEEEALNIIAISRNAKPFVIID